MARGSTDLSPLKGMKLRILNCDGIARVRPLATEGNAAGNPGPHRTKVEDLTALAGMKLEHLGLWNARGFPISRP